MNTAIGTVKEGSVIKCSTSIYTVVEHCGPVTKLLTSEEKIRSFPSIYECEARKEDINMHESGAELFPITPENFPPGSYILGEGKIYRLEEWLTDAVISLDIWQTDNPAEVDIDNPDDTAVTPPPTADYAKIDKKFFTNDEVKKDITKAFNVDDMLPYITDTVETPLEIARKIEEFKYIDDETAAIRAEAFLQILKKDKKIVCVDGKYAIPNTEEVKVEIDVNMFDPETPVISEGDVFPLGQKDIVKVVENIQEVTGISLDGFKKYIEGINVPGVVRDDEEKSFTTCVVSAMALLMYATTKCGWMPEKVADRLKRIITQTLLKLVPILVVLKQEG